MPVIGTAEGRFFIREYDATSATETSLPSGVHAIASAGRPLAAYTTYRGTTYISGYFERALMFTPDWGLFPAGVRAPMSIPTLAVGGSSSGSSGVVFGYVTFAQEKNGKTIQESNPAGPTGTITVTGQGFLWSSLPTVSVDPHVTHIYGYRSVDGANARRAWSREIRAAVTTLTENVLTADLGSELVVRVGLDNVTDTDVNARGVPPFCRAVAIYHDSGYWAGDPAHPDRIYPSNIYEPWAVNVSEDDGTFLRTRDGEAVVGLITHPGTDELIVFCSPAAVYAIAGYGPDDREMRKIPGGNYELTSHQSLRLVGPDADVWGACQEGTVMYNGTFRWIMQDWQEDWKERIKANPELFARCWAVYDREGRGYKLRTPLDSSEVDQSFYFFGQYEPVRRGDQPWWTTDVRTRNDTCAAEVRPFGKPFAEIHTGSTDGYLRLENVASNEDDDGDDYDKALDLTHGHQWLPDQEGDDQHGSKVSDLDVYLKNEDDEATVYIYAGDDTARNAVDAAVYSTTIPATRVPTGQRQRVARTSQHRDPSEKATGKGISVRIRVENPVGVEYRGYGVYYVPGVPQRPFSE